MSGKWRHGIDARAREIDEIDKEIGKIDLLPYTYKVYNEEGTMKTGGFYPNTNERKEQEKRNNPPPKKEKKDEK